MLPSPDTCEKDTSQIWCACGHAFSGEHQPKIGRNLGFITDLHDLNNAFSFLDPQRIHLQNGGNDLWGPASQGVRETDISHRVCVGNCEVQYL